MAQDRKVRTVMMDAGLYKEGSRDTLRSDFIAEEEITIAGKSYTLSKISYLDSKIFTDEMDTILQNQNPLLYDIFAKNAVTLFDAVRMANVNSKQGFKGALASGNELDFNLFVPKMFYDPDSVGSLRTTWVRPVAAAASKYFFADATGAAAVTMGEEEAMVWLAFYNPAQNPIMEEIQIVQNTEPFDIQTLDYEYTQDEMGAPIVELKEPWTLPPEQGGYIQAYYPRAGTDEARPLGIWIKMAKNQRTLGTP